MKKLLYITANSKPENDSASRKVSRCFVNEFLNTHPEYDLVELDLYKTHVPTITHNLFPSRAQLCSEDYFSSLSKTEKTDYKIIKQLCDQFLECDVYVVAAPMWSLFFPSVLKSYFDCVIQVDRTVKISPEEIGGLMNDIDRKFIYIQSSGGKYSNVLTSRFNYGVHYLHDLTKFLGIKKYETLLVENTGFTKESEEAAIDKAIKKIPKIANKF